MRRGRQPGTSLSGRARYCKTVLQQLAPCRENWIESPGTGTDPKPRCCHDEPMEANCKNVVDLRNLRCPTCKQVVAPDMPSQP